MGKIRMDHTRSRQSTSRFRPKPVTFAQKRILVNFIRDHPYLQQARFTPDFTPRSSQQLWQEITVVLNKISGAPKKNWMQWRNTWKSLMKNRNSWNREYEAIRGIPATDMQLIVVDEYDARSDSTAISNEEEHISEEESENEMEDEREHLRKSNEGPFHSLFATNLTTEQLADLYNERNMFRRHAHEIATNAAEVQENTPAETASPTLSEDAQQPQTNPKSDRIERSLGLTQQLVNHSILKNDEYQKYFQSKLALMREKLDNTKLYRSKKLELLKRSLETDKLILKQFFAIRREIGQLLRISREFCYENENSSNI